METLLPSGANSPFFIKFSKLFDAENTNFENFENFDLFIENDVIVCRHEVMGEKRYLLT